MEKRRSFGGSRGKPTQASVTVPAYGRVPAEASMRRKTTALLFVVVAILRDDSALSWFRFVSRFKTTIPSPPVRLVNGVLETGTRGRAAKRKHEFIRSCLHRLATLQRGADHTRHVRMGGSERLLEPIINAVIARLTTPWRLTYAHREAGIGITLRKDVQR